MKLRDKIIKFMYGRYGNDELNNFLFWVYILVLFINIFVKNYIFIIIELLLILIIVYRFLSKKIYKRSNENVFFKKIKNKLAKPFIIIKKRKMDKDHVYKKCHHCHYILKLPIPSERGKKHVICPKCKKRNSFIILKK